MYDYELLDFGAGRKLERFGEWVIDRVCPAAADADRALRDVWSQADVKLDATGRILSGQPPSSTWQCRLGANLFNLKLTPFGHVGLFPEQATNWNWLQAVCQNMTPLQQLPIQALNLFAYTGGSTLALAAAGAHVVHVDASAPVVKWGQRNAASNGLATHPIRWIVDDARKFVRRELRRGNRYRIIVLDPPSYGHGASGQRWSIDQDLPSLLIDCLQLLSPAPNALLLTAHSESILPTEIERWLNVRQTVAGQVGMQRTALTCDHARLTLMTAAAKTLDAGFYVRVTDAIKLATC